MSAPNPTKLQRPHSQEIFRRATDVLVGGVNSPVRAFRAVGGEPIVVDRAAGARMWDADGNEYIDYVCSWGALILGHAHPKVVQAIAEQSRRGTSYGMPTELEVELATRIRKALPSCEKVRFVSSGTEATMSAVRLARAATNRDLIIKFDGCYHGHSDSFLSEAGSGLATLGIAACPGVPQVLAELTLNAPYNDAAAVEKLFDLHPGKIGAVIVEPVAANMGVVPPAPEFLKALREITTRHGALLIFDEVITGFRLCYGGAQTLFGITPDLTTLGKIIGGGLPVAAYGGRRDLMDRVAPLGPVYQAGTLSGNPLAMGAGIASLDLLAAPGFYEELEARAKRLGDGIAAALRETGAAATAVRVGSLLTLFFSRDTIADYAGAKKCDTGLFAEFFRGLLDRGIFIAPSQFEALFVSAAHTDADIDRTLAAFRETLNAVAG
ncbi:MAG TPA: glutamate-1-semialdehyde 2,1-aminomutase [Candidatus Saccharimonadales bacterium]|jgi:glutamate-1-semialdehyde 2,1-aminomutase|nr:glutamate-1-semialdehyde 2,1-aminomutase [Candidatus Saccharimonadales bacterium]